MSAPVLSPSERAAMRGLRLDLITLRQAINDAGKQMDAIIATSPALLAAEPEEPLPWADSPDPEAESDPSLSDAEWAKTAPDAELERLLDEYRTDLLNACRCTSGPSDPLHMQFWRNVDTSRAAIRAEVQRREAAARGEVVGTGEVVGASYPDRIVSVQLAEWPCGGVVIGAPIALTRRAE